MKNFVFHFLDFSYKKISRTSNSQEIDLKTYVEKNFLLVKIDKILSNSELYIFAGQRGYHMLSPILLITRHYMHVNRGRVEGKKAEKANIDKIVAKGVLYYDNSNKIKIYWIKNNTLKRFKLSIT